MPIPPFTQFLLPTLEVHADGNEHTSGDLIDILAKHFKLSPADRGELLPSGKGNRLHNRVHWARTYLAQARLLERVSRGKTKLTQRGQQVLGENLGQITPSYLDRFVEFRLFHQGTSASRTLTPAAGLQDTETPEEQLEASYQALREELAQRLLEHIMNCSPAFFERLVVDLLVVMRYGGSRADAGRAVGQSGDGGIDGIINEDRLGLDRVYLQAKRWENAVGSPQVRDFVGSLVGHAASKGVLITTSKFTKDAEQFVGRPGSV